MPVNYAFSQGEIFFHCAPQGHKLLNLEHDPRVSFTVVQSAAVAPNNTCLYSSAIAFGTAERLGDPSRILPALQLLLSKYYGDQGRWTQWRTVCASASGKTENPNLIIIKRFLSGSFWSILSNVNIFPEKAT